MIIANGNVFCEDGIFRKMDMRLSEGFISEFYPEKTGDVIDAGDCYVVPGFVDIHVHGAVNADFSDGTEKAFDEMGRFLLKNGITSFLGTSMALPEERLSAIYKAASAVVNKSVHGRATLRGINMEGPFFSIEKRGAQNEKYIIGADTGMFRRLNKISGGNIRTVAVAPEIEGNLEFVRDVSGECNVSIAHTCAGYDDALKAFQYGANHVTHLFNGMSPFDHRNPGVVGAAADMGVYVELIADGVHVHPSIVRSVFKMFGDRRVCLISDAMRACGMPDGEYDLGGLNVIVKDGAARIGTGSLAGSTSTLYDCFRRAVSFGVPLESGLRAATENPAKSVGLYGDVGSLTRGKQADVLVLNGDLSIRHVIHCGELRKNI